MASASPGVSFGCGRYRDFGGDGELYARVACPGGPGRNVDCLIGRVGELNSPGGGSNPDSVNARGWSRCLERDVDSDVLSWDGDNAFGLGSVTRDECDRCRPGDRLASEFQVNGRGRQRYGGNGESRQDHEDQTDDRRNDDQNRSPPAASSVFIFLVGGGRLHYRRCRGRSVFGTNFDWAGPGGRTLDLTRSTRTWSPAQAGSLRGLRRLRPLAPDGRIGRQGNDLAGRGRRRCWLSRRRRSPRRLGDETRDSRRAHVVRCKPKHEGELASQRVFGFDRCNDARPVARFFQRAKLSCREEECRPGSDRQADLVTGECRKPAEHIGDRVADAGNDNHGWASGFRRVRWGCRIVIGRPRVSLRLRSKSIVHPGPPVARSSAGHDPVSARDR